MPKPKKDKKKKAQRFPDHVLVIQSGAALIAVDAKDLQEAHAHIGFEHGQPVAAYRLEEISTAAISIDLKSGDDL